MPGAGLEEVCEYLYMGEEGVVNAIPASLNMAGYATYVVCVSLSKRR